MQLFSDFNITRYDTFVRLVTIEDAEFILSLRLNPDRNKYLSSVSNNIEAQRSWLKEYKIRESKGEEYYFLVGDVFGKLYGTTRLYHFQKNKFVIGSWIFNEEAPDGLAIKGDIICREIAFDILGFKKCLFDVRKENIKVLKYHKGWNPTLIDEDGLNYYYELSCEKFNMRKSKILKLFGYGVE